MTTNRKFRPGPVELGILFDETVPAFTRNRRLFEWLCDWREADARRGALFQGLRRRGTAVLPFPSRAIYHPGDWEPEGSPVRGDAQSGHKTAYLLLDRRDIVHALTHEAQFSNSPYEKLGSGSFLLGLDGEALRLRQRRPAQAALRCTAATVQRLAGQAFDDASHLSLRAPFFDLADFAEQAALRFCTRLFGFATHDYPLVEEAMRLAYQAVLHQNFARHFVTDPMPLPKARAAMGALLKRACELIDEYQRDPGNRPTGVEEWQGFADDFEPVMVRLGREPGDLSGEELGVLVVGMMSGVVGNVQAAVCAALHEFFRNDQVEPLRMLMQDAAQPDLALWPWISEALRLHPPAAYLPRRVRADVTLPSGVALKAGSECVLAVVAALHDGRGFEAASPRDPDPLVFGLPPDASPHGVHGCIGHFISRPLICSLVRGVLKQRGLAEQLDPEDGELAGLERRWGFGCTRYPMSCRRDRQHALNVSMRIKSPIPEHAMALRAVIRAGAPRIEWALDESRHIHFAWFEFIEDDTRLVLHTVYDGLFESYIEHFALSVGELFDKIFEHVEEAPPMPVNKYPGAFLELIRRNDRPVAAGYFYSAYPDLEVAAIRRWPRGAA